MSEDKLKRLRTWWRKLRDENLVVEFDPHIPSIPGVSPYGGFAYRERISDDDDLLIRVNEYTRLTDEGEMIWCWPPDLIREQDQRRGWCVDLPRTHVEIGNEHSTAGGAGLWNTRLSGYPRRTPVTTSA